MEPRTYREVTHHIQMRHCHSMHVRTEWRITNNTTIKHKKLVSASTTFLEQQNNCGHQHIIIFQLKRSNNTLRPGQSIHFGLLIKNYLREFSITYLLNMINKIPFLIFTHFYIQEITKTTVRSTHKRTFYTTNGL